MRFSEAVEPYIVYCQAERLSSASTVAKYRDCFKTWLLPWLGSRELGSLGAMDIIAMRKVMVDKDLSVARQYSVVMTLKSFLKFCRTMLEIDCLNPTDVPLPKRGKPHVEYLDNEEVGRVLGAINIHTFTGLRMRALVELLLSTGLRISEALSLTRDPFDAGRTEVQVIGKGRKPREVFLNARTLIWLREYLTNRIDDHPALFITTGFPPRVLKHDDISRMFKYIKRRAGLQKTFTPRILRHTFCTNLLFNGADITHIRDLAGHQDIQTTARYYLGKDPSVLRGVVQKYLNYERL